MGHQCIKGRQTKIKQNICDTVSAAKTKKKIFLCIYYNMTAAWEKLLLLLLLIPIITPA